LSPKGLQINTSADKTSSDSEAESVDAKKTNASVTGEPLKEAAKESKKVGAPVAPSGSAGSIDSGSHQSDSVSQLLVSLECPVRTVASPLRVTSHSYSASSGIQSSVPPPDKSSKAAVDLGRSGQTNLATPAAANGDQSQKNRSDKDEEDDKYDDDRYQMPLTQMPRAATACSSSGVESDGSEEKNTTTPSLKASGADGATSDANGAELTGLQQRYAVRSPSSRQSSSESSSEDSDSESEDSDHEMAATKVKAIFYVIGKFLMYLFG
jgi:hypothetical protein